MMRYLTLKEIQNHLLKMAIAVKEVLEAHEIPYFITYGTLLGAVRHKGFIPWDDDFDFYLFEDSFDKAIEVLRKNLPKKYFVEDEKSEPLYFHGWAHIKDLSTEADYTLYPNDGIYKCKGISIDLYKAYLRKECEENNFIIDQHIAYLQRKLNKEIINKEQYLEKTDKLKKGKTNLSKADYNSSRDLYVFPLIYNDRMYPEELFPLKRYEFEGAEFLGPRDADVFLRRCYGDYMQLPPIEKRHPHYSSVKLKDDQDL